MRRRSLMSGGDKPIEFVDAEVKRICVEQWGGKDGGVAAASTRVGNKKVKGKAGEITYKQAASVKVIQGQFQDNAIIEYFDELQYFTRLERLGYSGTGAGNCGSFKNCTNLKHVTLPDGVKHLSPGYNYSGGTFAGCSSLTDIYLPDSIIDAGDGLFNGCTNIKTIRWSSNLNHCGGNCGASGFLNCSNLESITNLTIPQQSISGSSDIKSREFEGCQKLSFEFIDFSKVTKLSPRAFYGGCTLPTKKIVATECTSIEQYVFRDSNVVAIYLPKCTSIVPLSFMHTPPLALFDFGSNISVSDATSNAPNKTIVLRGDDYSSFSIAGRSTWAINKVYVYSSIINTFKTQHSNLSDKTFEIGGTEWTIQFGSSDEWADYPNGVNPYANTSS